MRVKLRFNKFKVIGKAIGMHFYLNVRADNSKSKRKVLSISNIFKGRNM